MARTIHGDRGALPAADDASLTRKFWALALGSVGVVYGDIGTSPLYAFKEAVAAASHAGLTGRGAVLGVLSLILWALLLIVTLKYVMVLLRADNKGEGGTFALMALGQSVAKRSSPILAGLGIAGAAFFYGDAVITPAISVLSAVEGLTLISPAFHNWETSIAVVILFALFAVQSSGTQRVAALFGPITAVWFLAMALGGAAHIADDLGVLLAINPLYGAQLLASGGLTGLIILGLVFLAVTGAEALYADLGHFGRRPIQRTWFGFILPALMLNYFGQGALVLKHPEAMTHPFFKLYPDWALAPMVLLATVATIIASQAVITGAFSITRQAVQLGILPRFSIRHTSESMAGQIYLPRVNWLLFAGVLLAVALFRTSSNLAAAYGVSVAAAMLVDSFMAFFVIWKLWRWPLWKVLCLIVPLAALEQVFFTANMLKFFDGGWFPLLLAGTLSLFMVTWIKGTKTLQKLVRKNEVDFDWLARKMEAKPPQRVAGTAVFFTADPSAAPTSLMHNLKHNKVLHERNIILTIHTEDVPHVSRHERIEIDQSGSTFIMVAVRYGFMETPSIPKILEHCRRKGLNIEISATSFFLSRRALRTKAPRKLSDWQDHLYVWLAGTGEDATTFFQIPTDRVVEIGTQVQV